MCFATAALVAGAVGAGASAFGAIEGGQATANAAYYAAQVAKNNQTIANQNADYAIAAGQEKAATRSLKTAATVGAVKAGQAAKGVDVNTGSAVDVQVGAREAGHLDAETVLNNSELQAYGYRAQGVNYGAQGELDTLKGDQAITGSELSAAGGLLSSAASLGTKWASLGTSGGGGSSGTGTSFGTSGEG